MPNGVEIVGLPEAAASMRRFVDQVEPEMRKAQEPWGQHMADEVRGAVPVLTGTLAGSVMSEVDTDGLTVGYDGSAPYDAWIEFGGSHGRPYQPEGRYLYPLAQAAEPDYVEMAERTTTELIEGTRWPTPAL